MKQLIQKFMKSDKSHLWWLLFWPISNVFFLYLEHGYQPAVWHVMHCAADDVIPFAEVFVIPYLLWFPFTWGAVIFTALGDAKTMKKLMKFIIVGYSIALITFFVYPSCQNLRPTVFPRENILTDMVKRLYAGDTNTNVCPSLHVIGSLAVCSAFWNHKLFGSAGRKAALLIMTVLICISTLFIKQHSALDVFWALPVSIIAQLASRIEDEHHEQKTQVKE